MAPRPALSTCCREKEETGLQWLPSSVLLASLPVTTVHPVWVTEHEGLIRTTWLPVMRQVHTHMCLYTCAHTHMHTHVHKCTRTIPPHQAL